MRKVMAAALCLLLLLGACRAEKEDGFSGQAKRAAGPTAQASSAETAAFAAGEEKRPK